MMQIDVTLEAQDWQRQQAAVACVETTLTQAARHPALNKVPQGSLSVLLTDDAGIRQLNARWRGKDTPTNVLSFPAAPLPVPDAPLGDIVIACETVEREAREQGKSFEDHFRHLLVHGFLHLLGYDHESDEDAEEMEALETRILRQMNSPDPYASKCPVTGATSGSDA